jgi:hypothetical protein
MYTNMYCVRLSLSIHLPVNIFLSSHSTGTKFFLFVFFWGGGGGGSLHCTEKCFKKYLRMLLGSSCGFSFPVDFCLRILIGLEIQVEHYVS